MTLKQGVGQKKDAPDIETQKQQWAEEYKKAGTAIEKDTQLEGVAKPLQAKYDENRKKGMAIATDMIDTAQSMGNHLQGIEYCLKGGESLSRKIKDDMLDAKALGIERSAEDAFNAMNDIARFTVITNEDDMVDKFIDFLNIQKKKGYRVVNIKNKWVDRAGKPFRDNYHGLHLIMKAPNGLTYETQFHTNESFDAKQNKTHDDYEIWRKSETPDDVKAECQERMCKVWDNVKAPKDMNKIKNYP